eukprot:m.70554 g.70554  ORF g.70554 m.70554 type:complete len:97 (+) comp13779_c1_seq1:5892-6182(+)
MLAKILHCSLHLNRNGRPSVKNGTREGETKKLELMICMATTMNGSEQKSSCTYACLSFSFVYFASPPTRYISLVGETKTKKNYCPKKMQVFSAGKT